MTRSLRLDAVSVTAAGLLRTIRPWQWYKQGVMLLGIVFSRHLFDVAAWLDLLVGVFAFTAAAGATYVFNDISDVERDRNHPEKRHRPIASGQVSIPVAAAFGLLLSVLGLLAALSIGPLFLAVIGIYFAHNWLYSVWAKRLLFVDVILVAVGFVLRAVAGVVAIDVYLSPWLLVSTFLLALVLALGKRRHELGLDTAPSETRRVLTEYSEGSLDQLLVMTMSTLLMAYCLYTFSRAAPATMATIPFAVFGVFRYHHLLHTADVAGQPEYLLTDRPMAVNLVLWATTTVAIIYEVPRTVAGVIG